MAIEIKGLASNVTAAKKAIADARSSMAEMQTAGTSLKTTAQEVTAAFRAAEADIRFEATQLGNGGETASETQSADTTTQKVAADTGTQKVGL